MADYWIKLYHEILDDPKMAVLPDRLWRRVIELFLMAGRLQKAGQLPDTQQIAWMLRMSPDALILDLEQIAKTGIIRPLDTGWLIVNFSKRQAAISDAERKKKQRDRDHKAEYYGGDNVTDLSRNVTQITDNRSDNRSDTDTETEADVARPLLFSMYEREIGIISPRIRDELLLAEKEYPLEWFIDAFKEAADHNARSWKYVQAILRRWKAEGRKDLPEKSNGHKDELVKIILPDGTITEAKR